MSRRAFGCVGFDLKSPLLFLFFFALAGCNSDGSGPPPDDRIGPAGGTLTLADGAVQLVIPAGALAEPVEFTASPTTDPAPALGLIPGTAYDLQPDGLEFAQPVQLTIRFPGSSIPAGLSPDELVLVTAAGDQWMVLEGSAGSGASGAVSGQIRGFSSWGVSASVGLLTVANQTVGEEPDDLYTAFTSRSLAVLSLPANDAVDFTIPLFEMVGEGARLVFSFRVDVSLLDVNSNCVVEGGGRRSIEEIREILLPISVTYQVTCAATRVAAVKLVRGGGNELVLITGGGSAGQLLLDNGIESLGAPAFFEREVETGERGLAFEREFAGASPEVTEIWTFPVTALGELGLPQRLAFGPENRITPAIFGDEIYFSRNGDIVVRGITGGPEQVLTSGPDFDLNPVPTPVGTLFQRIPDNPADLFVSDLFLVDGDGQVSGPLNGEFPLFSFSRVALHPDGFLLGTVVRSNSLDIFSFDFETGAVDQMTQGNGDYLSFDPAVRPNGDILFVSDAPVDGRVDAIIRIMMSENPSVEDLQVFFDAFPHHVLAPAPEFAPPVSAGPFPSFRALPGSVAARRVPRLDFGPAPPLVHRLPAAVWDRVPGLLPAAWRAAAGTGRTR